MANTAPTFSTLNGTPTYTENGVAVVLDSGVQIVDTELAAVGYYGGASLTLARNGGANAQDVFSNSGTLDILTEGGNLIVGGITIGIVTSNSGGILTLTFNGSATQALVNSTMQQIAYSNTSNVPPASAQIDWTFDDGNVGAQGTGGALAATGSTTVNITDVNDAPSFVIPDGKLTTDFGGGSDSGSSVTLQSDGKILVAGYSYNGSKFDFALARYNADGSLDTNFDTDGRVITAIGAGSDYGHSVTLQSDGKIVVAGASNNGTNTDFAFTRYNTNGSLDTSFGTNGWTDGWVTTNFGVDVQSEGSSVTVQTDGRILVAGSRQYIYSNSISDFALARYNIDGSLDTSFSMDGMVTTAIGSGWELASAYGRSIILQPDGKILVAGYRLNNSSFDTSAFVLVRYNTDGSLDTSFDTDGVVTSKNYSFGLGAVIGGGYSVTLQADGKILVAGYIGYQCDFALVRYNADGSLDTSFDGDGKVITDFNANYDRGFSVTT